MDPDDITVDFSGEIPMEAISELEKLVNQAITQNIDLKIEFPSEEVLQAMEYRSKKELHGVVRIVTVPGCDRCSRFWMLLSTAAVHGFDLLPANAPGGITTGE